MAKTRTRSREREVVGRFRLFPYAQSIYDKNDIAAFPGMLRSYDTLGVGGLLVTPCAVSSKYVLDGFLAMTSARSRGAISG